MWRKGNLFVLLMGIQIGANTVESTIEIPQNIKNGSAFLPCDPTSGNISKETQNTNLKEYMHSYLHCSIIYNSQDRMQPKCPSMDECIQKVVLHIYDEMLLGHKKE